jgi:hypothetical protein
MEAPEAIVVFPRLADVFTALACLCGCAVSFKAHDEGAPPLNLYWPRSAGSARSLSSRSTTLPDLNLVRRRDRNVIEPALCPGADIQVASRPSHDERLE